MQFRSTKSSDDAERASSTLRAFAQLELIANAETAPSLDDLARASGVAPAPARTLFGTRPHKRCTERTITAESSLRAELATVRARGYAVTDEELEPGLIALAAPVFRYDGTVVAAMSVSAPTSRMTREAVTNAARRCVDEAAGLSSALGYRPRPRPGTAKTRARRVADRA